jgi:hypothetical protein
MLSSKPRPPSQARPAWNSSTKKPSSVPTLVESRSAEFGKSLPLSTPIPNAVKAGLSSTGNNAAKSVVRNAQSPITPMPKQAPSQAAPKASSNLSSITGQRQFQNTPVPKSAVKKPATTTPKFKQPEPRTQRRVCKIIGNTAEAFKSVLESKCANDKELRESLKTLRQLIVKRGLPTKGTSVLKINLRNNR